MIESKAGSLRANHYHKTDWHYCYVLSGKNKYFYRDLKSNKKPELLIVEKGAIWYLPLHWLNTV